FAEAVVQMQPGQLHEPVRSAFGWHIPYLERIEPAVHKPWNDPEVRAEISANILTPIREREAQRYVFELHRQQGVEIYFNLLDPPAAAGENEEP
ncbi:MAG: peptidylprolyl isomerase, partial [Deltaproteobacteria bacterium]|nr:peptidylprolyl isomerase [Deltaproteobacteria bacterium]